MASIHARQAALAGALAGAIAIAAAPTLAQTDWERDWDRDWERENIPERLDDALRGMLDRMKPALEDMFDLLGVMEQIDNPLNYEKPVVLPNGDILIRRSPEAPEWDPDDWRERDEPGHRPRALDRLLDPDGATRI